MKLLGNFNHKAGLFLLFFTFIFNSEWQFGMRAQTAVASAPDVTALELNIDGLECANCSYTLSKTLQRLSFIGAVTTDFHAHTAIITVKDETALDLEMLAAAVHDAGFYISRLVINLKELPERKPADCIVFKRFSVKPTENGQTSKKPNRLQVIGLSFLTKPAYKKMGILNPPLPCANAGVRYWGNWQE